MSSMPETLSRTAWNIKAIALTTLGMLSVNYLYPGLGEPSRHDDAFTEVAKNLGSNFKASQISDSIVGHPSETIDNLFAVSTTAAVLETSRRCLGGKNTLKLGGLALGVTTAVDEIIKNYGSDKQEANVINAGQSGFLTAIVDSMVTRKFLAAESRKEQLLWMGTGLAFNGLVIVGNAVLSSKTGYRDDGVHVTSAAIGIIDGIRGHKKQKLKYDDITRTEGI